MSRVRGFFWKSDFFPRKLSFTREGKVVFFISIGLGLAAVNTGNNLLYLVFGLSLGLIIISGFLSEVNIRSIQTARMPRIRPQAMRPVSFLLSAENTHKHVSSFGLEVWPLFEGDDIKSEPARFLELAPGSVHSGPASVTFPRRGEYKIHGMVASTGFPFSFFRKSAVSLLKETFIVHPRVHPLREIRIPVGAEGEDESLPTAGRGFEFFGVRDFRVGDNPKNISHKLSAGRGELIVREFEQTGNREVIIALLNINPGGEEGLSRAEMAIEKAASVAVHLLQQGRVVGIASSFDLVSPGTGSAQIDRILDYLAVVPILELNPPGEEIPLRATLGSTNPRSVIWIRP